MEVWNPSTVMFDLSGRLFVPNRTENLNVMKGIIEWTWLKKCNLNQKWNNQKSWSECKDKETRNILGSLFLESKNMCLWALTKIWKWCIYR